MNKALNKLQRLVMTAHIRLSRSPCFGPGLSFSPETLSFDEWNVVNHPIQDATGSLFVTLLSIRRNRPCGYDSFLPSPYHDQLTQTVRRDAAARYSSIFKFYAQQVGAPNLHFVRSLMEEFLLTEELAQYHADWQREITRLHASEFKILLQEPLLTLANTNPMALAENKLFEEVAAKSITKMEALVMRGAFFFFLGSCLMNKTQDVIEGLYESVDTDIIAEGLVAVAQTCRYASKKPSILYKPNCSRVVDQVVMVLLDNAMSAHSGILRTGPYSVAVEGFEPNKHPVNLMVDPRVIKTARGIYGECMVT